MKLYILTVLIENDEESLAQFCEYAGEEDYNWYEALCWDTDTGKPVVSSDLSYVEGVMSRLIGLLGKTNYKIIETECK